MRTLIKAMVVLLIVVGLAARLQIGESTRSASLDRANTAAVDQIEGCAIRALIALLSVAADGLSSAMDRLSSEITLRIVSPGLR